ncbi:ribonuclease t2 [Moniliophthora roreri MCA 2997]|uniref:Ribonuclease t2 n=1 Tax=Moniliophthora roreri (strain MCA 2997) TaxID=1381753 RepID=V2WVQ1_MONRO|nr:ribonuclease t2 [Moniliophthora roreri MCA 2997]
MSISEICRGSTLEGISWYYNLKGSVIDGTFVQISAPKTGSCPSSGIKYPPKSSGSGPSTSGSTPTTNPGGLPAKAHLQATRTNGSTLGGLLSLGTWSTQTLAMSTMTGTTNSFTMTSSKGSCGMNGESFACGNGITTTTFSAEAICCWLLGGSTAFSSDGVPSGTTAFQVFAGSGHSQGYTLSIVAV